HLVGCAVEGPKRCFDPRLGWLVARMVHRPTHSETGDPCCNRATLDFIVLSYPDHRCRAIRHADAGRPAGVHECDVDLLLAWFRLCHGCDHLGWAERWGATA